MKFLIKLLIVLTFIVINSNPGVGLIVNKPLIAKNHISYFDNDVPTVENNLLSYEDYGTMVATWYGNQFHGRYTSSGDIYDQDGLTAAHKTLPFGTLLKVTNLRNNKSIIVRVNDRPGFTSPKRIDLSRGAAKALDMVKAGKIKIKVEVVKINYSNSFIAYNSLAN